MGRYRDLLDHTERHPVTGGPNSPTSWSAGCARLGHLLAYRNRVVTRLRWSLIMTSALIAGSVVALSTASWIVRVGASQLSLGVGCVWLVACLVSYGTLTRTVIRWR